MTSTELAILSLVVQEPRHGYQIEQLVKKRGMRDWADIGFSSIYYVLSKLERKGWVKAQTEAQGSAGPARRVYQVTEKGLSAWHSGVLHMLSVPQRYCTPLQVGLVNLPSLPRQEAISALVAYRLALTERRSYVQANLTRLQATEEMPWHAEIMFDLSLAMTEAELSWVKKLLRTLQRRQP